jgi:hypothetical protein
MSLPISGQREGRVPGPFRQRPKRAFTLALFDQVRAALLPRHLHDRLHLTLAKKRAGLCAAVIGSARTT